MEWDGFLVVIFEGQVSAAGDARVKVSFSCAVMADNCSNGEVFPGYSERGTPVAYALERLGNRCSVASAIGEGNNHKVLVPDVRY